MVTRPANPLQDGELILVVNASTKEADYAHMAARLPAGVELRRFDDRALLALQGPQAEAVLGGQAPDIASLAFMQAAETMIGGIPAHVSRSGYTGEDGFEISVTASRAAELWRLLMTDEQVRPIGLGARDSLRLEAGLCLYGHDIDTTTTPIEAVLLWSIGKERRAHGGFPGASVIQKQIAEGAPRKRVGLLPEGKAIAREGAEIAIGGTVIGKVTSGGFAPTLGRAVAMGYVAKAHSANGTKVDLMVRGKPVPAEIVPMPFVKHAYYRG
jgi:aminomethyltransferase